MELLLDASMQERQLRKRVRTAASLEEAIGEIVDAGCFETQRTIPPATVNVEPADLKGEAVQPVVIPQLVDERTAFHEDIADLLELVECGLPVRWPPGWDLQRARLALRRPQAT